MDGTLVSVARSWSGKMAAAGTISHNPSLASQVPSGWKKAGENVGKGGNVDALQQAFENSPAHYQNLVDPAFNYVGVGVVYGAGGMIYVTVDFMERGTARRRAPRPPRGHRPAPARPPEVPRRPPARTRTRTHTRRSRAPATAASARAVTAPSLPARPAARARPQALSGRTSLSSGPGGTGHTGGVAHAIETSGLTRSFAGRPAVDQLTFEVAPGEVVALLGPNGAGKTTTVRLLNGILRPDSGASRVLGLDPAADGDAVRRCTGVLTEAAGLDNRLTLLENVVIPARIRGMSRLDAERQARHMLERFDMAGRAGEKAQGLSTGQRKRVALARALLHEPEVLFLDEPTSGLDPEATRDVVSLIATLAREHGRTVLLCTHFLAEAGRLCQRMAVLQRGRLQAYGRPEDLAAQLWRGLNVDLDLGGPADDRTLALLRDARGVISVDASPEGAVVCIEARAAIPSLVANLVSREVPVFGAVPRPPTVEEIYFALQEQEKILL